VTVACGPGARDSLGDASNGVDGPAGRDGAPGDSSSADNSRVYAHSGKTLYRINTISLAPEKIGDFTGNGTKTITDIAVDKNDKMVGITLDQIYSIDSATGAATLLKAMTGKSGFTSLSYVPNPTDPNGDDILVTADGLGDVYQIDATTGDATKIGNYGKQGSKVIGSSGDIIGIRGLGIFATVFLGSPTGGMDYLATIDPANGWKATVMPVDSGYQHIFGLGFWAGKVYGFVDDKVTPAGVMVELNTTTGAPTKLNGGAIEWYGAGVTTNAPIIQ
jgi:hypothetical protein